jgi:hypothetical protein
VECTIIKLYFNSPQQKEVFLSFTEPTHVLGHTQPLTRWLICLVSAMVNQPENTTHYVVQRSAKLRTSKSITEFLHVSSRNAPKQFSCHTYQNTLTSMEFLVVFGQKLIYGPFKVSRKISDSIFFGTRDENANQTT